MQNDFTHLTPLVGSTYLGTFPNKALIPSVGPESVGGVGLAQCPSFLSMVIIVDHDDRDAAASDVNDGTHGALLADDANAVSQVFARVASHIMPEVKVVMRKMMIISRLEDKLVGSF